MAEAHEGVAGQGPGGRWLQEVRVDADGSESNWDK